MTVSTFQTGLGFYPLSEDIRKGNAELSLPQAFAALLCELEITEVEREAASAQQQRVRQKLDTYLLLDASFLTGSYRRHTLIRPLDDIDVLVVLSSDFYEGSIPATAEGAAAAIALIDDAIAKAYPTTERHRHNFGVQIQFHGTGIGFDIIPSFQSNSNEFLIPDTRRGTWIRTNPKEQQRLVSDANQGRCAQMLVPLIKLMKAWNRAHGSSLYGFHVEALTYHALTYVPASIAEGAAWLFQTLATEVLFTTPDIWPSGENADNYLTSEQRSKAAGQLLLAAEAARRAVDAEANGNVQDAHEIWFELFGDLYPESGSSRTSPDTAKPLPALDAVNIIRSGSRLAATSSGIMAAATGLVSRSSSTSHGGNVDTATISEIGAVSTADDSAWPEHHARLEREVTQAMAQFTSLRRLMPEDAAADDKLWPVTPKRAESLYAVLVGEQRTNFGRRHEIVVTIPIAMPAVEPRIYVLKKHVRSRRVGLGRFVPVRPYRHVWGDGAMCTHARRDHWDGKLVTLLIFAADWLVRQDYYQMTGTWIGHEIDRKGRLLVNGNVPGSRSSRESRRDGAR